MKTEVVVTTTITTALSLNPDGTVESLEHDLKVVGGEGASEKALKYVAIDALHASYTGLFEQLEAEKAAEEVAFRKKN